MPRVAAVEDAREPLTFEPRDIDTLRVEIDGIFASGFSSSVKSLRAARAPDTRAKTADQNCGLRYRPVSRERRRIPVEVRRRWFTQRGRWRRPRLRRNAR